jgi:hypothetical protein
LITISSSGTARKNFQSIIQLDLKAVNLLFLFAKNTPKYLYFSTDAFYGKEAKAGKRAKNCGVCKERLVYTFPRLKKSNYLSDRE